MKKTTKRKTKKASTKHRKPVYIAIEERAIFRDPIERGNFIKTFVVCPNMPAIIKLVHKDTISEEHELRAGDEFHLRHMLSPYFRSEVRS